VKLDRFIRIVLGLLIAVVFLIAIGALLFFTQTALTVWDRLLEGPWILRWGYVGAMIALVALAVYLIWLLLVRRKSPAKRKAAAVTPLSRGEIEARLRDAEAAGVDVGEAQRELQELAARQEAGVIHLCFFGEISTGFEGRQHLLRPGRHELFRLLYFERRLHCVTNVVERLARSRDAQIRGQFVITRYVALADTRPLDDPLVGRIDDLGQIIVR